MTTSDYIHISSDYGTTWSDLLYEGYTWSSVSMSASGKYQTAVIDNTDITEPSGIYISLDYGNTWTQSSSLVYRWASVSLSSSGQYQLASTLDGNGIYLSSDYGNTWTKINYSFFNGKVWNSISLSSSGQYQTVIGRNTFSSASYTVYISVSGDYGANWTNVYTLTGTTPFVDVQISSSGQYQMTINRNSLILASIDYGKTWIERIITTVSSTNSPIAMSSSGQYLLIAAKENSSSIGSSLLVCDNWIDTGYGNNSPIFSANLDSQSISANQTTIIRFNSTNYNVNGDFNTTSFAFQPIVAGYYLITCQLYLNSSSISGYVSIYKNGTVYRNIVMGGPCPLGLILNGSAQLYLNGTDYIQLYCTTNATITIGSGTIFEGSFLRQS